MRNAPLLGALGAVSAVPMLLGLTSLAAAPSTSANPGLSLYQGIAVVLVLASFPLIVVSQNAIAIAVNDIVDGKDPAFGAALKGGFRTFLPAIWVGLKYAPALISLGAIFTYCLASVLSRDPTRVVWGIIGVAVALIPYGLTWLAAQVAVVHAVLRRRDPSIAHFAGGLAAWSTEGRNILAALTSLALDYVGWVVVTPLGLVFRIEPVVLTLVQQCVAFVATVVSFTFLTLFYLDLRARNTGADLAEAVAALRQETGA